MAVGPRRMEALIGYGERRINGSMRAWSAMPYAAVAPINGAPRTSISLMARAASSIERKVTVSKRCGNLV